MSATFTKLFTSITESTVWCEPDRTRIVWICMLAMADRKGCVWASVPGLANRARVPIEDVRIAINTFMSPDPDSRTPKYEGRRIAPIEGGWHLLNYEDHRGRRDTESVLESKRKYINNRRAKERAAKAGVDKGVDKVDTGRSVYTEAEAEAEAEAELKTTCGEPLRDSPPVLRIPLVDKSEFPIDQAQVDEWTTAYPGVDVIRTLHAVRQWNLANPTKRKTKRGILTHCNSWLAKEQNGAATRPAAPKGSLAPWWSSDASIEAFGKSMGLSARPGETMGQFKGRIDVAISKREQ